MQQPDRHVMRPQPRHQQVVVVDHPAHRYKPAPSQITPSQVKSIKLRRVKSRQVTPSQVKSRQVKPNQAKSSQVIMSSQDIESSQAMSSSDRRPSCSQAGRACADIYIYIYIYIYIGRTTLADEPAPSYGARGQSCTGCMQGESGGTVWATGTYAGSPAAQPERLPPPALPAALVVLQEGEA